MKTRMAGPSTFIQLHLELDGGMPLREVHVIAEEVEAELVAAFPGAEVIIHQDPHEMYVGATSIGQTSGDERVA
jgi:ferrous-iron efflux pump FieF